MSTGWYFEEIILQLIDFIDTILRQSKKLL